jgi:hypothetical protein
MSAVVLDQMAEQHSGDGLRFVVRMCRHNSAVALSLPLPGVLECVALHNMRHWIPGEVRLTHWAQL